MVSRIALCIALLSAVATSRSQTHDSELRTEIERYSADETDVEHIYSQDLSPRRWKRLEELYSSELKNLQSIPFEKISHDGQVDYVLLRNHIEREQHRLQSHQEDAAKMAPLISFLTPLIELEDQRALMEKIDPEQVASTLNAATKQMKSIAGRLGTDLKASKYVANLAVGALDGMHRGMDHWFHFYSGYDPMFTWWVSQPYKDMEEELTSYRNSLKEKLLGVKADDDKLIVGNPIGRDALLAELKDAMIPYTPEELVEIANKQYAWCEAEMKKASNQLGFGDDWKKALEHVKQLHVEPGKQTDLIHELAEEAIKFVEDRHLVTIPQLAKDSWKMEMMSPQAQLVNPFFLGGEDIIVSYPTADMAHDDKMMSMRGNNRYFSRATVFHELIPGHHLQDYMTARYKTYRQLFYTPFWIEGWALHWEMLLWDQGFPKTPEEKIGMLFWRMHRCARIIFSLSFHLGKMTPEQCVDLLVDKVGHERANAEGEVRRSLNGSYEPLYQAGYMLGALQIRALHHDLVDSGKMTNQQFHDAILKENTMPIEMVRAILTNEPLTRDYQAQWRFGG